MNDSFPSQPFALALLQSRMRVLRCSLAFVLLSRRSSSHAALYLVSCLVKCSHSCHPHVTLFASHAPECETSRSGSCLTVARQSPSALEPSERFVPLLRLVDSTTLATEAGDSRTATLRATNSSVLSGCLARHSRAKLRHPVSLFLSLLLVLEARSQGERSSGRATACIRSHNYTP